MVSTVVHKVPPEGLVHYGNITIVAILWPVLLTKVNLKTKAGSQVSFTDE
jgi:hypothetical protein